MTAAQRAHRRGRVMNMLARLANDPDYHRQQFRAKVGGQLAALLARAGVSAAQVARKLNISPAQLSRQLGGDANLTLNSLHSIAVAAGARVSVEFEPATRATEARRSELIWRTTHRIDSIVDDLQLTPLSATPQVSRLAFRQARERQAAGTHFSGLQAGSLYLEFDAANEPVGSATPPLAIAVGC